MKREASIIAIEPHSFGSRRIILVIKMAKLQYLVIHCADTPPNREVTKADIEQWHLVERGWSRVGYADLIQLTGKLVNLREFNQDGVIDPWEVTNGAKGYNGKSRHVVYAGGYKGIDTRTEAQKKTMEIYVKYMILRNPDIKVIGHNQISYKKCPSFNVPKWLKGIGIDEKNIGL